jgi:NADH-ubiquinone oxidoreductase chain 2
MLLIGLTSLLIAIPLYSSTITPSLGHLSSAGDRPAISASLLIRITSITLLFGAALSFNTLYLEAIGSGLGLYSGLFYVTNVTQYMEIFLLIIGAFVIMPWSSLSNTEQDSTSSATPGISEYPLIVLFTTIGALFLISSSDLVSMYLSIELQSFAVYILAAIYRNSESATSAGLKYFLLGALSSALILLGSSFIYAYTGLTHFEGIYSLISVDSIVGQDNSVGPAVALGVFIIGVGFLFKVAAAPFHNWAPDVYDGVPTIVTTWLTVMPKISIFVFLLELTTGGIGSQANLLFEPFAYLGSVNIWQNLLLTTSLLSLIIGTVVGLAQYRIKRLLAFSTISHVGFLLLALSVNSEESISSLLFYLIQYSITNLNAFFVILALGYLIHSTQYGKVYKDLSFISQLKGQFYANPILALSLALCLFSMAGIPPLIGFFAKYMVLYSAIENGYYFLSIIGILASVVSAAYYLRMIRVVFMEVPESALKNHFDVNDNQNTTSDTFSLTSNVNEKAVTSTHSYVIAILTLFILFFILSPSLILNSSNLLALSLFTA